MHAQQNSLVRRIKHGPSLTVRPVLNSVNGSGERLSRKLPVPPCQVQAAQGRSFLQLVRDGTFVTRLFLRRAQYPSRDSARSVLRPVERRATSGGRRGANLLEAFSAPRTRDIAAPPASDEAPCPQIRNNLGRVCDAGRRDHNDPSAIARHRDHHRRRLTPWACGSSR